MYVNYYVQKGRENIHQSKTKQGLTDKETEEHTTLSSIFEINYIKNKN
jgi:hypothetical protein